MESGQKEFTGKCPTHGAQPLDYFCNTHWVLCCSQCKAPGGAHQKCIVVPFSAVDLNTVRVFLQSIAKYVHSSLTRAQKSYLPQLEERQRQLNEELQRVKEEITAQFRLIEAQRDKLFSELEQIEKENEFVAAIDSLKAADASGAAIFSDAKRVDAEWDPSNGKEMTQSVSEIYRNASALCEKVTGTKCILESNAVLSFSPNPSVSLGEITYKKVPVKAPAPSPKESSGTKKNVTPEPKPAPKVKIAPAPATATANVTKVTQNLQPQPPSPGLGASATKTANPPPSPVRTPPAAQVKVGLPPPEKFALKSYGVFNNCVLVSKLPKNLTEETLLQVFSLINISHIDLLSDDTAIIQHPTPRDVRWFVKTYGNYKLNNVSLVSTQIPDNSILVEGLPSEYPLEILQEAFSGTPVASTSIIGNGLGVVSFESNDVALAALNYASGIVVEMMDVATVLSGCTGCDEGNEDGVCTVTLDGMPACVTENAVRSIFKTSNPADVHKVVSADGTLSWVVCFDSNKDAYDAYDSVDGMAVIGNEEAFLR